MSDMEELNRIDDEIVESIKQIETRLRERVSIAVSCPMDEGRVLYFGKHNGAWCFYVKTENDQYPTLLSMPRQTRRDVGPWIEKLIASIPEQLKAHVEAHRAALGRLKDILARFDR